MGHFWATFGLRRTKNGIILKMLSHFAVLICHITSKIHHCWFYGKFTMFFNLNMICGEFWLPIVSENVSEIDVTLTYVSWIFNKITIILFFCVVWELRFGYPIEYCALLRSSMHIKLILPSPNNTYIDSFYPSKIHLAEHALFSTIRSLNCRI